MYTGLEKEAGSKVVKGKTPLGEEIVFHSPLYIKEDEHQCTFLEGEDILIATEYLMPHFNQII